MTYTERSNIKDRLNQPVNEYRYLLLDPLKAVSIANPLHLSNLRKTLGDRAIYPILRRDLAYTPGHCPFLVLLASPGECCNYPWLEQTEEYARSEIFLSKRYLCGWLSSTEQPAQLATTLAAQCDRLNETECLPFFEPLRFELLQAMSSQSAFAGYLWPISHWWYMSVTGEVLGQTGAPTQEKWQMSWAMQNAQQHLHFLWKLLFSWHQISHQLPHDAVSKLYDAFKYSEKTGLPDRDDRQFLALTRLTQGIDIEQHPVIAALVRQAIANPSQRILPLIQTVPDTVWLELESQEATKFSRQQGSIHYGA